MGLITKLQAVNQMLLASGENLVADLGDASGIDTGIAETILDQMSLDFQMRGMANNKIVRIMQPDSSGHLLLSAGADADEEGIISAELVSTHITKDGWMIRVRISNNVSPPRLWNITEDTDVFPSNQDYYIEMITKLPWENLDTPVQRAILASAIRQYQIITQGDEGSDAFLGYQEQLFNAKGRAADINDKKRNIFNTNSFMRSVAYRTRYLNDPNRFRYWNTRGF